MKATIFAGVIFLMALALVCFGSGMIAGQKTAANSICQLRGFTEGTYDPKTQEITCIRVVTESIK